MLIGLLPWSAAAQFQLQYFQVNSLSDEPDQTLGDGVCSTLMGTCTLRAAVQEADVNGGGIEQGGGTLTMSGCTIMNNAAANGGGVFSCGNLTIEHSFIATNQATYGGGGLMIATGGTAALTSVGFEGNTAPGGNGIWSLGSTTLKDVDVQSH